MSTLTLQRVEVLRAPAAGSLRWLAPRALAGELETFDAGEPIALVDDVAMRAPARGFVLRRRANDGDEIADGRALALFARA